MTRLYCTYVPDPGIVVVSDLQRPLDNNFVIEGIPNCTFAAVTALLNEAGYTVDKWIKNSDIYSYPVHVAKIRRTQQGE